MASNPLTPLQQAKRDLQLAITRHAATFRYPESTTASTKTAREVDQAIDDLITEAQAAAIKSM